MTTILPLPAILAAAPAVLALVLLALHLRQVRRTRALGEALSSQAAEIERLNADLAALLECSRTIGTRVNESERAQRALHKRIDSVQLGDENQVAVQHAMKLLESGWDMKEVTDICDLTQGEVEILRNLRQHRAA